MVVTRINTEEMPNQREREMHPDSHTSEELSEIFSNQPDKQHVEPEIDENIPKGTPAVNEPPEGPDDGDPNIIVRLSWEKDKWAVIKRMEDHMGAFPETKEGFLVYYNDATWFKVKRYDGEFDSDIVIDGIKYDIIPYEFSKKQVSDIESEALDTKLLHLLYSDEDGYPTISPDEKKKRFKKLIKTFSS